MLLSLILSDLHRHRHLISGAIRVGHNNHSRLVTGSVSLRRILPGVLGALRKIVLVRDRILSLRLRVLRNLLVLTLRVVLLSLILSDLHRHRYLIGGAIRVGHNNDSWLVTRGVGLRSILPGVLGALRKLVLVRDRILSLRLGVLRNLLVLTLRVVLAGLVGDLQRHNVGVLGLVAVLIHQRVGDGDIRLFLRSVNRLLRLAGDCAALELQPFRKALNLDRALLQLEALWQLVKAFRLHFLLVVLADDAVGKLGVRHRDLGDHLLLTLLRNEFLFGLLDALFRICLVRVFVDRFAIVAKHRHILLDHDLNLASHDDLSGTRGGRLAGDLATLRVDLKASWQILRGEHWFSALFHVARQILEQRCDVVIREIGSHRTQRQRLRHNSREGVGDLPSIRRLAGSRVNRDQRSGVDRGLLQVFRSLEVTRLERALVVTLDLA